jgi:predicted DNA-binding protein with PD1-like motif
MEIIPYEGRTEIFCIGLGPGELLWESIEAACREKDIRFGAVISGIAALKRASLHHVEHSSFPPNDIFFTIDKPLELLSINGMIVEHFPHLHVALSCGTDETYGGHLEKGSIVSYLSEIVILKFNTAFMQREYQDDLKIKLLKP